MIKPAFAIFIAWVGMAVAGTVLAQPAFARPVEVTSGEHDGFTRVVLNFGSALDWTFGRVLDGYRFRPANVAAEYDLGPVFDRIGTSRLAAISQNPSTSELDIGFDCACHAIAFEFRPGIIVIDLRDGPPPKGSSFENALPDIMPAAPNAPPEPKPASAATAPQAVRYNWLDRFSADAHAATSAPPQSASISPAPSSNPDLQPLREQLLRQLSRGAAEGVVDLAMPKLSSPLPPKADLQAARVALGEMASVTVQTARAPDQPMGAQGMVCLDGAALAFSDWGAQWADDTPAATILAQDMNALVGEFDVPNPSTVASAVKARLFLGFGREARQIINSFPTNDPDQNIWISLSYLLDGEADPTTTLHGQAQCNTPAALWAVLADQSLTSVSEVNAGAVILGFSRLPPHLRKLIGPQLIDRFLALGDTTTASTLRDATLRASGEMPPDLLVAEAKIDLAKGDPSAAEARLDTAATGATVPAAKALITRVNARIAQDLPVDAQTVSALAALQSEMGDTEIGPDISRAMIHAEAASGNFDSAFAKLAENPAEAPVVWRALATLGDDSTLLQYAVPAQPPLPEGIDQTTISAIAQRLMDLGLPQPALDWLYAAPSPDILLMAQGHLAQRDGASALAVLQQSDAPEALPLRAAAQRLLGNHTQAAQNFASAQQDEGRISALARAQDWDALAQEPRSNWAALAADIAAQPRASTAEFGPLATGAALAEQSATTRQQIENLFSIFAPQGGTVPAQ